MNKFSIEYPEYHIAGLLKKDFPKAKNYSVCVPISRQQKDYDLLLYNGSKKRCLSIQVKSARTFINSDADLTKSFHYYAWLNSFQITNNHSDFFFLFISYPLFDLNTFRPKTAFGTKILVFTNSQMKNHLSKIKKTKKGHPDRFFALVFNIGDDKIYSDRGFDIDIRLEFSKYLYENQKEEIKKSLDGKI